LREFWHVTGPGGGWGAPPNSQVVGGIALDVEPMSPIAACARTADHVDAFVTAATGALLISTFDRVSGTWSALAPIAGQPQFGGQPLQVGSVDGAVFLGGAEVGVAVTGRDQPCGRRITTRRSRATPSSSESRPRCGLRSTGRAAATGRRKRRKVPVAGG